MTSGRGTRNLVTQKTPENRFSSVTRQLPFMPVLYPLIHKRVGLQRPLASYFGASFSDFFTLNTTLELPRYLISAFAFSTELTISLQFTASTNRIGRFLLVPPIISCMKSYSASCRITACLRLFRFTIQPVRFPLPSFSMASLILPA